MNGDEGYYFAWGSGLYAAAFLLFLVEVLIPSGGIIGIAAVLVALAGVIAFFFADTTWGIISLLALIVLTPVLTAFALKVFPRTPFGKHLILGGDTDEEEEAREAHAAQREREQREREEALVGMEGVARTDLRPVGSVTFEDSVIEVQAEMGFVAAGTRVKVTRVEGNRVRVRPV